MFKWGKAKKEMSPNVVSGSGRSYDDSKHLWGIPLAVMLYLAAMGVGTISWVIRVEQILSNRTAVIEAFGRRLEQIETGFVAPLVVLQQQTKVLDSETTILTSRTEAILKAQQLAQERVDRLDTPLSKIVEQIESRQRVISERLLRVDGRVDALFDNVRKLEESRPSGR